MLLVAEVHVVRQVVHFVPFDRIASKAVLGRIVPIVALTVKVGARFRIKPDGGVNLADFYLAVSRALLHSLVAVHANVGGRDARMLGLVSAVVAVLAVDLIFAHVDRVNEFHRLLRQIPFVHPDAHQPLIAFHHSERQHKYAQDGHEDHVAPCPCTESLEVTEVLELRPPLTLADGICQPAVHAGRAHGDQQEHDQEDDEPKCRAVAGFLHRNLVDVDASVVGIVGHSHVRRVLDVRHDVTDIVGRDRLCAHPTVRAHVSLHQRLDVPVAGGCSALWVLDPLNQELVAGAPPVSNASQTRGGQHVCRHQVTRGTIGVEQCLSVFHVASLPDGLRKQ